MFVLSVALISGVGEAAAQVLTDPNGGGGSKTVGAVSELMAAALQTAGVYAQAKILVQFKEAITWIAALCFLASVTAAIASTAIFGTYRKSLYLLVGPALFYFVLDKTDSVDGVAKKVGERLIPGSVADQKQFLSKYVHNASYDGQAQVSYVFLVIDNLVSAVVQDIVALLVDTKNSEDIVVQARERVFSWILLSSPDDPALLQLVAKGAMGECAKVTSLAIDISNHRKDGSKPIDTNFDSRDEWNLTPQGLALYDQYQTEKVKPRHKLDMNSIKLAYPEDPSKWASYLFSCEETWDLLKSILFIAASKQLDIERYLTSGPRDTSVPWSKVRDEVLAALKDNGGGNQNPAQVLAVMMLRNILGKTQHAAMTSSLFSQSQFNAARRTYITEDLARADSYAGFLRIQYFAGAIPYIQGVLLYLLAIAFPFFAIFLVMPSRAETFFIWISLWVWVKSWDIGFAFVAIARKIMWVWMRHSMNQFQANLDWSKPETVFIAMSDNDPFATSNTYYQITALMTVSVPILMAYCCLGATNLFDAFKMSIDQTANRFGQLRNNWTRREVASRAEREMKEAQHNYAAAMVQDNLRREEAAVAAHAKDKSKPPGFLRTADGKYIANRGDGSKSEMIGVIYMTAAAQYRLSDEGLERAARLGASSGRVVSQMAGSGRTLTDAYARGLGLSFVGQDYGTGHHTNGMPDPSGGNWIKPASGNAFMGAPSPVGPIGAPAKQNAD